MDMSVCCDEMLTRVIKVHEYGGNLEEEKDHGQECTRIVPPEPVPAQVEAVTRSGDCEERADSRGDCRQAWWRSATRNEGGVHCLRLSFNSASTMTGPEEDGSVG